MELKQARVFLAVAEELHFGRAAERLYMAQPPVTRIIKELERSLDTLLFERSTRRVALTSQGEALIAPAKQLVEIETQIRRAVRASSLGESGRLRLAFAGSSTHVLISRLARRVKHDHPGILLELHSQYFAQSLMRRIVSNEIDIGFGRWDFIPAGIETRLLVNEQLVMAIPASHPLAAEPTVRMEQFEGDAFVSLPPYSGAVLTDRLERLGREAGFVPEVVQVAPDTMTALAMVAAEMGPSLTLLTVADHFTDPHVVFAPVLDEAPPVQLRMAWRADMAEDPVLRSVLTIADEELPLPSV